MSAHAHATEDEQRVLRALRALLPEVVEVQRSKLEGHHGNPIIVFEAKVDRRPILRDMWKQMTARLRAGELEKIRDILSLRTDESCHLYLRFDKQLAFSEELALTESGDAIHLKLKVAAFPAKREVAIKLVEKFIEAGQKNEK